jgi:hypothetical protein
VPAQDSALPSATGESDSRTRGFPWPARRGRATPGQFKLRVPPGPSRSRHLCLQREPPKTLAATAVDSPPPPLSLHREAVQVLRLEVRNPPSSLVAVLACRSAWKLSPDFTALAEPRRRVVRPRRRVSAAAAALVGFAAPRAARRSSPRFIPSTRALFRVRRRAPPPFTVGRRRRSPLLL